jgi:ribonuclease P protein subunit RPR2
MAKKEKEETPNVNATQNRDISQRLNFLYQASVYLQSIAPSTTSGLRSNKGKKREEGRDANSTMMVVDEVSSNKLSGRPTVKKHGRRIGKKQTTGDLARSYIQCMRVVGQKTTVKM